MMLDLVAVTAIYAWIWFYALPAKEEPKNE